MGNFDPNRIITEIYLDGEEVPNVLIGLSVTNEVNRIPRARIELNYRKVDRNNGSEDEVTIQQANGFDPQLKNSKLDFLPGKEISITLGRGQDKVNVFEGYITKQNLEAKNSGAVVLSIDCKHRSNRMTSHKRTRFFHHDANKGGSTKEKIDGVEDLDVLRQLVEKSADYGLTLDVDEQSLEKFQHENMTQYNVSDWDFLITRAEALSFVCIPDSDHIRMVKPKKNEDAVAEFILGEHILEYESEYDETHQSERNYFTSWDFEKQKMHNDNLKNGLIKDDAKVVQTPNFIHHEGDIQPLESNAFLANEVSRQELDLIRGTVKVKGTVNVKVGDTISITGFESVWDRNTFVSGIKHELRSGSWFTYFQCGLSNESHVNKYSLQADSEQAFMPKTSGLLYGVVSQYKKSDSGHELIEVELAAYNENDEKNQSEKKTIYARLATFSAGKNGGAVFRPYPGDEVVIGFVNNDPRFPVILGSLYNGKYEPPYDWEDHETQFEVGFSINDWKISIHEHDELLTISSPGGQRIVLDDCEQSILMAFDDNNGITITSDGIEMDASKIILKGKNGIELSGSTIEGKADTSMKLEGGTQLELEGKVTASLKGQITNIN